MKRLLFYVSVVAALCMCLAFAAMATFAHAETAQFSTTARSAVVMEQSTHRVLFSKNPDARLPMASTTKVVTALTVINHADLDETVEIPSEACGVEGSSVYLRAGEHLTVRELLLGLMLRSGNDCAVALALHVGGTVEAFAEMMNETARENGCNDCNFTNPHGLHDEAHYTSARDLAVLTCVALNNKEFRDIVSTKTTRISNEGMEYDRILVNKNKLLKTYDGANGVKTGYTKKAGRCFVGSACKNGMEVVAVVLNCGPMFEETADMLDVAFENYRMQTAIPQNKICGAVTVGNEKTYYFCPDCFSYPVKSGEKLSYEVDWSDTPCIRVLLDGNSVWERNLEILK